MNTYCKLNVRLSKLIFVLLIVLSCFFVKQNVVSAQVVGVSGRGVSEIVSLLKQNRLIDAKKKAEALTSSKPSDHSLYYMLGFVYYHSKDYNAARLAFSKAISLNRNKGDAYYYRALTYIALNKPEKALKDLNIALKDKNTPYQLHNLALILRSKTNIDEWLGNIYHFRAMSHKFLGQYSEGIEDINRAIKLYNRKSPYSLMIKADLMFLTHNYTEAYNEYQDAIKLGYPGVVPKYNLSLIDFYYGNYQNAINHLKDVLEFDPEYPNADLALGVLYLFKGDLAKAESIINEVNIKNPSAGSSFQLAFLYHLQGDQGRAAKLFPKALKLDPEYLQTLKIKLQLTPDSSPTKEKIQTEIQIAEYYLGITVKPGGEGERNKEPVFAISEVVFSPKPVMVNNSFTITFKITADITGEKVNIPAMFFFTINQGDNILFTSEQRKLTIVNGLSGEWVENMKAVPVIGNFTLSIYAKYSDFASEKHVEFTIK